MSDTALAGIQAVVSSTNFFDLFSLPQDFKVDESLLEREYRRLQAAHHPDRVAGGEEAQRLAAVQTTSLVNDAYDTLKSPVKRAAYLLRLAGLNPDEHNQAHLDPDFLISQMQWRESLEDLISQDDLDGLAVMKQAVLRERDAELDHFAGAFGESDLTAAKAGYHKLQFLFKLLDEIESAEEQLLDY